MDVKSTIQALEKYAGSNPHSKNERNLLKLTTINGQTALTCVPEHKMTPLERFASFFGFSDYKLSKITAFLSTDEFCTALKSAKLEDKDIRQLKIATKALSIGIHKHNNKIWFLRWTIDKDLTRLKNILDCKVTSVAAPRIKNTPPPTKTQDLIKQLESSKKLSTIEMCLVRTLRPELSPNDAIQAQVKALGKLSLAEQNDDTAIREAKRNSLVQLCNCTAPFWDEALDALSAACAEAERAIPPPETKNTTNAPELAHKQIQQVLSQHVRYGLEQVLDAHIKALAQQKTSLPPRWKADVANLPIRIQEHVGICENALQPRYDFYNKWGTYLQAEMIQGFKDSGETLGRGICWALSLRWCIAELEKTESVDVQDMVAEMKIGSSDARDRFNQAFLTLIQSGEAVNSSELDNLKKRHNIVNTYRYDWAENIEGTNIQPLLKKHLPDETFIANQGVGQLCFWWNTTAHAICICCQPDTNDPHKSIFRISDPNIGTLHFSVPAHHDQHMPTLNKYVECLAELLTTFYSTSFKKISCFHFEQGRSPIVEK